MCGVILCFCKISIARFLVSLFGFNRIKESCLKKFRGTDSTDSSKKEPSLIISVEI